MSLKNDSQIWEKDLTLKGKFDNNKHLSRKIVVLLRKNYPNKTAEHVATELGCKIKRVNNWIYADTGLTAFDLFALMQKLPFIKEAIIKNLE